MKRTLCRRAVLLAHRALSAFLALIFVSSPECNVSYAKV